MPLLSAFTPCGLLEFSSEPSEAEKAYDALSDGYRGPDGRDAIDLTPGTHKEATIYATAMAIGAVRMTQRRAADQANPGTSYDLLRAHARRFRLPLSPKSSISDARDRVAARAELPGGARRQYIETQLRTFLDGLIAYRVVSFGEVRRWPSNPAAGPGLFCPPDRIPKTIRFLEPIVPSMGTPITIPYENWTTADSEALLVAGDILGVQPENLGLAEKVTVLATSGTGTARTLTALFFKSHDLGASATTGPLPLWNTTKRHAFIIVDAATALDVEKRRAIDEFMERTARGTSTWAIVQPTSNGAASIGPFTLDSSPLGLVPLEQLDIVPSAPPAPTVTSLTPNFGALAGGNLTFLTGTGFALAARVNFRGTTSARAPRIEILSDTRIRCITPAFPTAETVDVDVISPFGTGTATAGFTYS